MYRTHTAGALRKKHVGKTVILSGWVHRRRDHGGVIFIDLRDRYGITQIVFDPSHPQTHEKAHALRSEFVIRISGTVRERPKNMANPKLDTGDIEILVHELDILNPSQTPPFEITDEKTIDEPLRLKYRYLDLRRTRMRDNIIFRSKLTKIIRDFLTEHEFLEIETPILIKGTPEGAREYIVPSRIYPGNFYVLPQSPQQLKQLLMVAGFDKYFQLPRCFRDEDTRGDRQPEFTQLDIEMSFVTEDDVLAINESLSIALVEKLFPDRKILTKPFPRLTWQEAMERFGSDKPDLRFGMELTNFTDMGKQSQTHVFNEPVVAGGVLKALKVPGGGSFSRKEIDELTELAKVYGAQGLAYITYTDQGPKSPILKHMNKEEISIIQKQTKAQSGDIVFFQGADFSTAVTVLGHIRLACAQKLGLIPANVFSFCWITQFPLFERSKETNELTACHHPFTSPLDEDISILSKTPEKVRAKAYDLALNGVEIAGGSIRIHDATLQKKIFDILNISEEDAKRRFGHLLEAFRFGAPPHGGIAWGLDRIIMLFRDEPNIREVIPFPKDQKAKDLMLGAPSCLPSAQIREAHIKLIEN